ncbi:AAA family ATPase [Olivibacter sitiensis]|uniref:AAA family ATPase n=1 Tax=Olivibacter sitiensis TaxID=376470 RepID=UPI00042067B3|nr:AAA family ATPase [Olivibacter sitiensis]
MPALSEIILPSAQADVYPFNIASLKNGFRLSLKSNVTFFVGENGSGKSTVLEGIAEHCGFNLRGGNRNHNLNTGYRFEGYESPLAGSLKLVWSPRRITEGFFMRAESFFNFASYIDELAEDEDNEREKVLAPYGGKSLHEQSHGESFLSLFTNQFESGIYILDEPEAALSPARILSFISIIHELEQSGRAQFLIATHSPLLICYPNASIFQFDESGVHQTTYQETEHFQLTKSFVNNPDAYLKHLMR